MRLSSFLRKILIALLALVLVYLLGSWLLLPRVLQSQAEKFIAEKTGHHLSMARPEFNPFKLSLTLHALQLTEPDGKPLLGFKQLLVDFSATSLVHGAWVFDAVQLDGLETRVVELPEQKLNWSALLDALKSKEPPPATPTPLPRLEIASLGINGGHIELADQRSQPGFTTHIEPLDLHLENFSTLPNEKDKYRLSAQTDLGAKILWQGELALNPLSVNGQFSIDGLSLARVAPLLKLPLRLAPPEGTASLAASYRLSQANGQIDLLLDQIEASIGGLKLRAANGAKEAAPLLALDSVALKGGRFDLRQREITVASVALAGGGVELARGKDGRLNLLDLLPAKTEAKTPAPVPKQDAKPRQEAASAWRYRIDRVALSGFAANFRDQTVTPVAQLGLHDIALDVVQVSDKLDAPWPVRASFNAATGGRFEAQGNVIVAQPAVDLQLKLNALSLAPVQPYLGAATTLTLASGTLSSEGRARYGRGADATGYSGSVAVNNLRLTEAGNKTDFLVWKALTARKFEATPTALRIGELGLAGLDMQLIIAKDKSVNLARVLRPRPATATTATAPATPPSDKAAPYRIDIDRLRIANSEMDFADYSLMLPFGTRIHHLRGTINGLSSRPGGAPGQLELDGQVDDYGVARAVGQIDLFKPTDFLDLKVKFQNIEMTRLTPYVATFAGRKIETGKLSLDLDYQIKQRQLAGDNKVVIDRLTLGERVESPQAKDLPLDLAIALLQDSDGRIDLGLPVSGSLDDPEFSYGALIWKVITNVLTKVATAPFRALGALFGGGDTALENIAFEAGRTRLSPPEREKLVKLAASLGKRPGIALSLRGTWADADRVALQDVQLRRAIAKELGQPVDERDPGPISTGQPQVREALEDLYADRVGKGELAALKDGFRKANPGQLEQSGAGKMLSRLSNVFREKKDLTENEVAQLKGADFHAVLYQRLRDKEAVADERLQALATARGTGVMAELKAANAPEDRVTLLAPGKVEASGNEIPLGMEATAAGRKPDVEAVQSTQPAPGNPAQPR